MCFNTEQATGLTVSALPKGNSERLMSWGFKWYQFSVGAARSKWSTSHERSWMFTEVATSKLLACLTLVTKPLRAPKPSAWPWAHSLEGREPCESSDPKEWGSSPRPNCAGVYTPSAPAEESRQAVAMCVMHGGGGLCVIGSHCRSLAWL